MKLLGSNASFGAIRGDLVYLNGALLADDRRDVRELAVAVGEQIGALRAERELLERAEDAVDVQMARRNRGDRRLDGSILEMGGVARATEKSLYGQLFSNGSPSVVTRKPVDEEVAEVGRILGELERLPEGDLLREGYLSTLKRDRDTLAGQQKALGETETALALARSRAAKVKLATDKLRLEVHGRLTAIVKDKVEADSFFKPAPRRGGGEDEEAPEPGPTPEG